GLGVVCLGGPRQVPFESADLVVVGIDQGQVDLDVALDAGVGEARRQVEFRAVGGVAELLGQGRMVVLAVGVDQVGQALGASADEVGPPTQQVACLTHALGVDVGLGQHAAAQEDGDLFGVDL